MSLVPYGPAESRQIVLRHGSAVVVYDQRSKQLSLRSAPHASGLELADPDCPYCHRPLREQTRHQSDAGGNDEELPETGFVNPEYFRMLHHSTPTSTASSREPSPRRRLDQRTLRHTSGSSELHPPPGAEFVASAPASSASPHGISSTAFSQNYFKTFFEEERELGRGGKGVVLLVKHVLDGVSLGQFACKRVPVGDDHEWLKKVLVEVQLLQNLSHQNLVSYRHVWLEDYQINSFSPSVPCAFILQQYCNAGDLHHYVLNPAKESITAQQLKDRMRRRSKGQAERPLHLNEPRRMQFEEIFSFFKDITAGLHHLHANGYIHRDLKPHNCLLHTVGGKTRVLVSDFGEVQVVNVARNSTGSTGTISYCAPEVLRRETTGAFGNFTTKSDVFSLGMIVYFMCFGGLPYKNADDLHEENEDLDQLRAEISQWIGFEDARRVRSDLPDKLYWFLKRLLSMDPNERPTTEQILQGIGAASGLEEVNGFGSASIFEDIRPRISPADSPSPGPGMMGARKQSTGLIRPPTLRPRQATAEEYRSPSPPVSRKPALSRSSTPPESTVVLRARKVEHHSPSPPPEALSPTPRLALPPPSTLSLRLHHIFSSPLTIGAGKLAIFLVKVLSVSRPCSPFAANPWVAYPLLTLAAFDFALVGFSPAGFHAGWVLSLVLMTIHFLVTGAALRWDGLCLQKLPVWQDFSS
ncbi:uncharacterized protein K452DRAFT_279942 [Aplosporella prunicola CBS 121167]|uniref:non-specific serine/threonine protein kinase n=1 Tax=Aplosporella prunicola CBS 121167 TaxID=1176127 RepID=A0A6A6AZS5_9PEZI|nr:uncharacterized protein K452DRAFT_279942 [Aplosporella prunicola CBS 121167]KAF2136465.1 hypothetical protein K452DRAFT_279942 [Aplosporella prunicola CBS 121167]